MSPENQKQFLANLTETEADELFHDWAFQAREEQLPPAGDWQTWLYLAGRGAGKTRSGAEWIRQKVKSGSRYIGLVAPTQRDIRAVMIEGQSGLLSVCDPDDCDDRGNHIGIPLYEPSKGHKLTWANGASAMGFSAEEPTRLRGPQHDTLWCDELAAWKAPQDKDSQMGLGDKRRVAWDMAMFGLRIGDAPQCMVSTTPRPIPLLRELLASPTTVITRSSTYANRANLAKSFLKQIVSRYEGTRLGQQELLGELVEEAEGALWTRELIAQAHDGRNSDYRRVVVAVDPAVSTGDGSALTGIVVAAVGTDGRGYVITDLSGRHTPDTWARIACDAFDQYGADRVVAEGNQGGDMVRHTLKTVRPTLPVTVVHATRSKQARAEPVAALYEQGKVTHLSMMTELENQLCTWEPLSGDPSPDRLDALVWAITDLMLRGPMPMKFVAPPYLAGSQLKRA